MESELVLKNIGFMKSLNDDLFVEFIGDVLNWMKGFKISFIKKYKTLLNPVEIPKL